MIEAVRDGFVEPEAGAKVVDLRDQFVLPGLFKATTVQKPATKARKGINPFTKEEVTFAAKPASVKVRVRALKKVNSAISG